MWNLFLNFIAPKRCYGCKTLGSYLCEDCVKQRKLHQPYCYVCKKLSPGFQIHDFCKKSDPNFQYIDAIFVWTHYRDTTMQKMIKDAKFYKKNDILRDIPHLFQDTLSANIDFTDTYIAFAPMHFLRKWKRGYNHSEILAQTIANMSNTPILPHLVQKAYRTIQQSKLAKKSRLSNLKNSFKIHKKYSQNIENKSIVLVDDVISSGATVCEISKLLHWHGVKKIQVVVIASD